MNYRWSVYNKQGALITRTLTRSYAVKIALQYNGKIVRVTVVPAAIVK